MKMEKVPLSFQLREEFLTEASRQDLLTKSRRGRPYALKNQTKGRNRFERRLRSQVKPSVREYNVIDMDRFFKRDFLSFGVPVIGETSDYLVTIEVQGLLEEIRDQIKKNKDKLEFKVILSSLSTSLNRGDVNISCTCPDFKYRHAYHATRGGYKAGYREPRPSDKTNPDDDLGAGCKHTILVLANLSWMYKVASVINNYIRYSRERLEHNYVTYIFPKVFGVPYNKAVQLKLFYEYEESGLLPTDQETIASAMEKTLAVRDEKGHFIKDNPMRFQKKETQETPLDNPDQVTFNLDELPKEEENTEEEEQ